LNKIAICDATMIKIPKTDLIVHPLCLGANVFGWSADKKESNAVLDGYVSHGGNFIDTADAYSQWKPGNQGGESETVPAQVAHVMSSVK